MHGHAFGELLLDGFLPVFQGLVILDLVLDLVVALHRELAVLVGEAVCPRQLVHVFEDGVLVGDILVGQVLGDLFLVQLFHKAGMGEEAFDLRAEEELIPVFVVVKGLDAEDVPGAEEQLLLLVPDDKGEHPPQLLEDVLAVFLVPVEDGFRIGAGLEDVAFFQQILPQALEVVDLPVEDKHLGAVLVENGLAPAFQIDDGKPPEAQGNLVIHIVVGVGPAPGG